MIHEIINPSDQYTIECDDMSLLTASIFLLGEGAYGTSSEETDFKVPMTIFGGNGVEFFKETFNLDLSEYVKIHRKEIANCLLSICLGNALDRKIYFSTLDKLDENSKKEFTEQWYEKNQSSMNGIGQRALKLAEILKKS